MSQELEYEAHVTELKSLLKRESEIGFEILKHLLWIEDSELFLDRGFPSLFSFCVKELKMTENQAYYRINAVREMRVSATVSEKLEKGEATIAQVTLFAKAKKELKQEGKALTEKETESLFEKISGKSVRESEKILRNELQPERPKTEKITVELTEEEMKLFLEFKAANSHALKDQSHTEGFRLLLKRARVTAKHASVSEKNKADLKSNKITERETKENQNVRLSRAFSTTATDLPKSTSQKSEHPTHSAKVHTLTVTQSALNRNVETGQKIKPSAPYKEGSHKAKEREKIQEENKTHTRTIPALLIRALQARSKNECEYIDPFTHRKCDSKHFLQIDHILSFSKGGSSIDLNNLQLLCASHNRRKYESAG